MKEGEIGRERKGETEIYKETESEKVRGIQTEGQKKRHRKRERDRIHGGTVTSDAFSSQDAMSVGECVFVCECMCVFVCSESHTKT